MRQPPPSSAAPLPTDSSDATQAALAAEHAALWVYGLVSAFLPPAADDLIRAGMTAHQARRDATERLLAAAGLVPRPAEPAYLTPKPVTDQLSATAVLVTAETDCCVAWRAVLEHTDDGALRKAALEALTESAILATRCRKAGGATAVVAMPGQP